MPKSVETITAAAKECFFQHGFSATNVSLIGRYADISRATIYKNFSSKEEIFRAVVQRHMEDNREELYHYTKSTKAFWLDTEALIVNRCKGVFDEISGNLIRSELIHACQTICGDILQKEKDEIQTAILQRLETEIANERLTLEKVNLTPEKFAQVIESVPLGVAVSSMEENNLGLIQNMFNVLKASTME